VRRILGVPQKGIASSEEDELMVLIAVYCIFDLAYPNMYSQLLGICQEYILIQSSLIG
jgi:hypothetical protein